MNTLTENKLWRSHSLEKVKDDDGVTTSGSMTFWEDAPVSPLNIGDDFQPVPNGPVLKVGKVSISDSVIGEKFGKPYRQWQITVESETNAQVTTDDDTNDDDTNVKYTFLIEKDNDGVVKNSGSMQVSNTGDTPTVSIDIDEKFTVPGIGEIPCTKVSGGDEYTNSGEHKWSIVYEGEKTTGAASEETEKETETLSVKYTFLIEQNNDGIIKTTGTMQVTNTGDTPSITINVGDEFSVPGIGSVTCTKVNGSDDINSDNAHEWTILYEGARVQAAEGGEIELELPQNEEVVSYELNGVTTRSVSGEFIVLVRSGTPVTKKSITLYTSSAEQITTIGSAYLGGIAISEQITKETQKTDGIEIGTYYRHDIEVES